SRTQLFGVEVGQRLRILRRAAPGKPERGERFQRHHPGRDRGGEALGEEGTERLILPRLDVARRPVIQQTEAEHVLLRLRDGNRAAEAVAAADEHTDLELEVE